MKNINIYIFSLLGAIATKLSMFFLKVSNKIIDLAEIDHTYDNQDISDMYELYDSFTDEELMLHNQAIAFTMRRKRIG